MTAAMLAEEKPAPPPPTKAGSGDAAPSVEMQRAEMMDWLANYSSKRAMWNEEWPLLRRTARLLAVVPILLFAYFALSWMDINQVSFIFRAVCYAASCGWNHNSIAGLSALWGILAAGLVALLIVEFIPRNVFKGWALPASSLAIVSAGNILIYPIAFTAGFRLGPDNPIVPTLWLTTISCGLLFFGIGCVKLTTLKGPYTSVAIGLSFLNGFVMLLHVLLLISLPGII